MFIQMSILWRIISTLLFLTSTMQRPTTHKKAQLWRTANFPCHQNYTTELRYPYKSNAMLYKLAHTGGANQKPYRIFLARNSSRVFCLNSSSESLASKLLLSDPCPTWKPLPIGSSRTGQVCNETKQQTNYNEKHKNQVNNGRSVQLFNSHTVQASEWFIRKCAIQILIHYITIHTTPKAQ